MSTSRVELTTIRDCAQDGIAHRRDLSAAGLSRSAITKRCTPDGPWQRLLPGVVLLSNATPTRRQRLRAALTYAGPGAVVTGLDALRAHGAPVEPTEQVCILLPADRKLAPTGFVTIERTTRAHGHQHPDGLCYAPAARATLDLARRWTDHAQLRKLLSLPVCHGLCSVAELRTELESGSQRGSAAPRAVLRALSAGVEPATLAFARTLATRAPLPHPRWDVAVTDRHGRTLATVDAWWDEVGMAWTITGKPPESRPEVSTLAAAGITLVSSTPARLHGDPDGIIRELARAFLHASRRRRPPVLAMPAPADRRVSA